MKRMNRNALSLVAFLALASRAPSAAADTILATCNGQRQGQIKGEVVLRGYEDWIGVFGFGHGIVSPRDPASGLPTGRRQHQPLRIFKTFDRASPSLYQALIMNEALTSCEIQFLRAARDGRTELYFTIELKNAFVSDITAASGGDGGTSREVVSFVYQRIIWRDEIHNVETEDEWGSDRL